MNILKKNSGGHTLDPTGTHPWPLLNRESLTIPLTSAPALAETFSDPDPTTTVVSGSEKEANGKRIASCEQQLKVAMGGVGGVRGRGKIGEKTSCERAAFERDEKILSGCYDHGFVTRGVIERSLLRTMPKRSITRVFDRLVIRGLLLRPRSGWLVGRGVYQLTKTAHRDIRDRAPYELPWSFKPDPFTFRHDEAVIETRLFLEEQIGGVWQPERALRTEEYQEIPDGVLHLPDGSQIAVEVEFSKKHRRRLRALLARWRDSPVSLVLYVCGDESVARFVESVMAEFKSVDYLALITIQELRAGRSDVWTPAGMKRLPRKGVVE